MPNSLWAKKRTMGILLGFGGGWTTSKMVYTCTSMSILFFLANGRIPLEGDRLPEV